jgi:hypothetical protein
MNEEIVRPAAEDLAAFNSIIEDDKIQNAEENARHNVLSQGFIHTESKLGDLILAPHTEATRLILFLITDALPWLSRLETRWILIYILSHPLRQMREEAKNPQTLFDNTYEFINKFPHGSTEKALEIAENIFNTIALAEVNTESAVKIPDNPNQKKM